MSIYDKQHTQPLILNKCKFNRAWIGDCGKECQGSYCEEHLKEKCAVCGNQATRECCYTSSFVCGVSLCPNCTESNTGWGATAKHTHVKKVR